MGETRRLGIGGGFAAALHALVGAWLAFLPQRSHAAAPLSHVVEIVVVPSEPIRAATTSEAPLPVEPSHPARRSPDRSISPALPLPFMPAPSLSPSLPMPPSSVEPAPRPPPLPSLAPSDVASALVARETPGPSQPGPPASRDLPSTPLPNIHTRLHEIAGWAAARANAGASHPTEPPHLVAHPDGSLRWQGANFGVVIAPDGEIAFSDASSLQYDWRTASGSFCIECAFMDPYAGEREWFVEATAAVRDEREDRARVEREERALRRLEGRLAQIWQAPRSPEHRRRALFDLWDESAEDERGQRARELVLTFIRESLPRDDDDAFSARELATLNAARQSAAGFAPY